MGWIGLTILVIIISFIGVTVMGWDNFIDVVIRLGEKFVEFVQGGFVELQERVLR